MNIKINKTKQPLVSVVVPSYNHLNYIIRYVEFGLAIFGFLSINYLSQPYAYSCGVVLIVVSGWYSVKELDKRLGLLAIWRNFRKK